MPVTTEELVRSELTLTTPADDAKLAQAVAAAVAYVARYHSEPVGDGAAWPADYVLGATKLAANLYRNANSPGVSEPFGGSDTSYRRATDVQIEQLLRIGRFAAPMVG